MCRSLHLLSLLFVLGACSAAPDQIQDDGGPPAVQDLASPSDVISEGAPTEDAPKQAGRYVIVYARTSAPTELAGVYRGFSDGSDHKLIPGLPQPLSVHTINLPGPEGPEDIGDGPRRQTIGDLTRVQLPASRGAIYNLWADGLLRVGPSGDVVQLVPGALGKAFNNAFFAVSADGKMATCFAFQLRSRPSGPMAIA